MITAPLAAKTQLPGSGVFTTDTWIDVIGPSKIEKAEKEGSKTSKTAFAYESGTP